MIAIDAATGATVWKTTLPGGRYTDGRARASKKGPTTAKTAAGYGRVYVHATNKPHACLHAHHGRAPLDPLNGQPIWPSRAPGMVIFSGEGSSRARRRYGSHSLGSSQRRIDRASPLPLGNNAGHQLNILTGNSSGRVVCVNEETGEIQWELSGVGDNAFTMSVVAETTCS